MSETLKETHRTGRRPTDRTGASNRRGQAWAILGVCACLVLAVGLVFGQTSQFEFINVDDSGFVFENSQITPGLTLEGIRWAFTDGPYGEWTPITSISHMLDCQLYGTDQPGLHHLTNVLLHATSAVLLFLVLLRMTNQRAVPEVAQASGVRVAPAGPSAITLWPCAWVAAVIAVHPLHVSTVAWVSERREVLAGLFFMLALGAYALYVERPSVWRYLPIAGFLALGLMSKAILVTFPLVLLLLDYWPLRRFQPGLHQSGQRLARWPVGWRLVVEKIPLLCLSAASSAIVMSTHASFGLAERVDRLSLPTRLANALVASAAYVGQSLLPIKLSPFYPNLGSHMPAAWVVGSLVLLVAISVVVGLLWRRQPYLAVGWLWFLGMLVPVLGLVGHFVQGRADNYTYLSQIGLSIAVAWGVMTVIRAWQSSQGLHGRSSFLSALAAASIVALAIASWNQTRYWQTSEAVWTRTVEAAPDNAVAHYCLARIYAQQGKTSQAIAQCHRALAEYTIARYMTAEAHVLLAECLDVQGNPGEAMPHFQQAVELDPRSDWCHSRLAIALFRADRLDEAIAEFREAVRLNPAGLENQIDLANALLAKGQTGEAIQLCQHVLRIAPDVQRAAMILNLALAAEGKTRGAAPISDGQTPDETP